MSNHRLETFDIGSFDPISRRSARARRTAASAKATPPATPVKSVAAKTRSADPVAIGPGTAETEAALLRAEVAGLREVAAAALAEAASAREVAEGMQRSLAEARRLEAWRSAPRITLLERL